MRAAEWTPLHIEPIREYGHLAAYRHHGREHAEESRDHPGEYAWWDDLVPRQMRKGRVGDATGTTLRLKPGVTWWNGFPWARASCCEAASGRTAPGSRSMPSWSGCWRRPSRTLMASTRQRPSVVLGAATPTGSAGHTSRWRGAWRSLSYTGSTRACPRPSQTRTNRTRGPERRYRADAAELRATPMRIVLSRKGFDSGSGGCPSPIFPDGSMLALPIPDRRSTVRYCDIASNGQCRGDR
jgi:hypothetical protein